jgi:hypothetical protein
VSLRCGLLLLLLDLRFEHFSLLVHFRGCMRLLVEDLSLRQHHLLVLLLSDTSLSDSHFVFCSLSSRLFGLSGPTFFLATPTQIYYLSGLGLSVSNLFLCLLLLHTEQSNPVGKENAILLGSSSGIIRVE